MDTFGQTLRRHRQGRNLSLRQLADLTQFAFTFLSQVERGERKGSEKLARICDGKLEAHGALIEAYREEQADEDDMHRRTVLRAMGALAASPLSLVRWEALRHSMAVSVDLDIDRWDQVVADYGLAHYRMPVNQIMDNLQADLVVLQALIVAEIGPGRGHLMRAAARLSVVVALNMVATGQILAASRWWRDARQYAEASRDSESIVLTRAWDVVNGCYDGRSPSRVIALSEEVLPLVGELPSAASCGLLAGRAQALSLAGRHVDAIATVQQLAKMAEALPTAVVDDADSLWGWPEHRLRHTEVWVYAHAGQLREATRAQEQAVALYPAAMTRLSTQVQLHQAAALIRTRHVPDGLRLAAGLLDALPKEQHNRLLLTVVRQVMDAVPVGERRRPAYQELTERVTA
ncbi:helix-turn-helix domain-containing protein [Micromonosporaceae bacterium Da 78-11]